MLAGNMALDLRVNALRYHGTGEQCTSNFHVHTVDADGNCFSGLSLTYCWGPKQNMML